ncbi:VCBS repeat-containing protein [Streptomyces griseus]|uniref:FG-GAP repeat domain-containing protein n=1 Tax=Streptomyces griseus TaxID=1911 RepID=UPI0004CC5D27|nr:VCBS repeat-containing protein [Streptomyces griseus]
MSRSLARRRRLPTAIAVTLAVALGAGALAAPSFAVPAGGTVVAGATAADADLIAYPKGGELVGAGVSGFLTRSDEDGKGTFRPFSGGAVRVYAYGYETELRSTRTSDFVVERESGKVVQRELGTDAELVVPLGEAADAPQYAGSAGDAVYTTVTGATGTVLRKHTRAHAEGAVVAGLPSDASGVEIEQAGPDHAEIAFRQGGSAQWGLLDLATGAVTGVRAAELGDRAASSAYSAWVVEQGETPRVFAANRTGDVRELPVAGEGTLAALCIGVVGDWIVYGQPGGMNNARTSAHYPLTAHNFVTGATERLFDHVQQVTPGPDGRLYVRGGIVGRGEGLYRVTDTGGAKPLVEKVATTGEPTEVVVRTVTAPPTVLDLDKNPGAPFRWTLSRPNRDATLTVRHVRTGKTTTFGDFPYGTDLRFSWPYPFSAAPRNGDYTWRLTVRPDNGIGPAAVLDGAFKVVRKVQPHDFTDNGTPDLLTRDAAGRLWRDDLHWRPAGSSGDLGEPRAQVGSGWTAYDRFEAAGNLGGSAAGDVIAREPSGALWLHQGNGNGGFAPRVRVGGGWQSYVSIAAGSDLTGDGRPDVLATDRTGVAWLHPGTGVAATPFAPRRKAGWGWNGYNDVIAVGNIAGGPAGDIVARDRSGVLWLHLGKGDGTFAARTRIGRGWNTYATLVGTGDVDKDGRPDLVAIGKQYEPSKLYRGTGDWKAPLSGGLSLRLNAVGSNRGDLVF